jgi:hypothetical protein
MSVQRVRRGRRHAADVVSKRGRLDGDRYENRDIPRECGVCWLCAKALGMRIPAGRLTRS